MTDVRIAPKSVAPGQPFQAVDFNLLLTPAGQLDTSDEMATAVVVALMTDALAGPDDELPDSRDTDRRGWWGDVDAKEIWDGWPIGSKLWLLSRTTITGVAARKGATTVQIEDYIREALQPFLDRRIASRLDVTVVRAGVERIEARIVMYRGDELLLDLRFSDLWAGIVVSAPTG
ncbi:Mu-like prophage protein gp46 [Methylobacterium sp. UNC378MF]|uniref:phage GP46 family protein n=1 Tax=Methylobacterium sp. UNC378MF TaxID=1502748 RepID=UPI00088251F5|nr:phage GP46 family protein [Methylobacterium sp. UNC378MF]SDA12866.1 Mu-like prophage protein gp46 [Methylobacterium sp. UNC378MF]